MSSPYGDRSGALSALRSPQSASTSSSNSGDHTPGSVVGGVTTSSAPRASPRASPAGPSRPVTLYSNNSSSPPPVQVANGSRYSETEWQRLILKLDRTAVRGSPSPSSSSSSNAPAAGRVVALLRGSPIAAAPASPSAPGDVRTAIGVRLSSYNPSPYSGSPQSPRAAAAASQSRVPHSALSPRAVGAPAAPILSSAARGDYNLGLLNGWVGKGRGESIGARLTSYNAGAPTRDVRVPHSALSPRAVAGGGARAGSPVSMGPPLPPKTGFVVSVAPYVPNYYHRGIADPRLTDADRDAASYLWRSDSGVAEAAIAAALASYRGQLGQT